MWDLGHTPAATNLFGWGFVRHRMQDGCAGQHSTPGLGGGQSARRYSAPHRAGSSKLNAFASTTKESPAQQIILANRWGEKIWQTKLIIVSQLSMKQVDALNDRIQGDWLTSICWAAWKKDVLPWGRKICLLHTFFYFFLFQHLIMKVSSHTAEWLLPYSPHGHEANSVQQAPDNLCPAEPWRMTLWKAFGRAWAAQRKPRGLLPVGWSLVQLSTTPLWSCRALSLCHSVSFSQCCS